MPVPESGIDCGLFCALSVTIRVPECEPFVIGLKVTLIVHVAFGFMGVVGQVLVSLKSLVSAPIRISAIDRAVPPALVSVTNFVTLPELVFAVPKATLPALNCACGLMTVAVSMTVCGLPAALSLIFSVAVCGV